MPQQIGWSVESKLLYEIKQLTRQLSGRQYILTFPNFASFPTPGITGTLYVDESTGDIYVWNGAAYTLLSAGITALNGLIAAAQLLTTGSTGTDFNISSVGTTHTFNIPTASATNRGLLSSANWTTFNNKQNAITLTTTGTSGAATLVGSTLNIPQYQSVLTNPVTGTGTTNYIPKFTAGSTIGNSQIFDNGNSVGIGTISPANVYTKLQLSRAGYAQQIIENTSDAIQAEVAVYNTADPFSIGTITNHFLNFKTNNTERLRIFANGRVGINTTTDAGYQLDVNGTLRSVNGANFATTSGNVGVGTTTPQNDAGYKAVTINGTTGGQIGFYAGGIQQTNMYGDATGLTLVTTAATPMTFLTNSLTRMTITSGGNVGIGATSPSYKLDIFQTGQVGFRLAGTTTAGSNNGQLRISDATTLTKNLSLGFDATTNVGFIQAFNDGVAYHNLALQFNGGNVGIGTTSPQSKLEIYPGTITDANRQEVLRIDVPGSGIFSTAEGYINFRGYDVSNNVNQDVAHIGTQLASDPSASNRYGGNLLFYTRPTGSSQTPTERLRITSAGNVGIGTTSPAVKLDVAGRIASEGITSNEFVRVNKNGSDALGSGPFFALYDAAFTNAIFQQLNASNGLDWRSTAANLMRLSTNAELLINTTTDAGDYKLQVAGNIYNTGSAVLAATSGNVGIGVTPSAWGFVTPLQIKNSTFAGYTTGSTHITYAASNWYLNGSGTDTYIANGNASIYSQSSGQHIWLTAPSGTAGNAITFTQAMTLNDASELLVNTTTDAGDYKLQVAGNQYLSGKLVVGTTTDSGQTVQINSSLRLIPTSTVPTASAGTLYYDTATNKLKLYDGTSWVDLN